jgi:hypothetical protein
VTVFGDKTVGIFVHIEGTDEDGTCCFESGDGGGVFSGGGFYRFNFRTGEGGDARDVVEIFDGEGNPRQRSGVAAGGDRFIDSFGGGDKPSGTRGAFAQRCGCNIASSAVTAVKQLSSLLRALICSRH